MAPTGTSTDLITRTIPSCLRTKDTKASVSMLNQVLYVVFNDIGLWLSMNNLYCETATVLLISGIWQDQIGQPFLNQTLEQHIMLFLHCPRH